MKAAFRVVAWQSAITLVAGAVCWLAWDLKAASSALVGGGVGVIATSFMAFALFRHSEGTSPTRIAWSFFLGEFLKVALSIGLLVTALRSGRFAAGTLLATYMATFVAYWLAQRGPPSRH